VARIERHNSLTPLVVTEIGIPFKVYTGFCVYQLILFGFFIQTQKFTAQYNEVKGMTSGELWRSFLSLSENFKIRIFNVLPGLW